MCLIIHKPAGVRIPRELLLAAVRLNADGWGLMGHDLDGQLLLERHTELDINVLLDAEVRSEHAEITLHLRRRTRGRIDLHNTHPFEIDQGLYLMHNGTLNFEEAAPGVSDTRGFTERVLRPLSQRYTGLLADGTFLRLLELSMTPQNKVVLYNFRRRRFDILNAAHGAVFEGLWLSSIKWIDAGLLPLTDRYGVQQRGYVTHEVGFL